MLPNLLDIYYENKNNIISLLSGEKINIPSLNTQDRKIFCGNNVGEQIAIFSNNNSMIVKYFNNDNKLLRFINLKNTDKLNGLVLDKWQKF